MPSPNRPRSLRRAVLFFLLLVTSLVGLLIDLITLGPTAQPAPFPERAPHTIPNTDLNPYGVNVFLHQEVEEWKKRRTMEMIADAGIGWVKQQFPWAEIEPTKGSFWDYRYDKSSWQKFDEIVDLAEEYGLEIIARLDYPPEWARGAGTNPAAPPLVPRDYADFVYEFVRHYRGRIHYIQIWNEPNLSREWVEGQPVDPRGYVTLLQLAYQRAKEADPQVQVLSAPLAARTTDDPNRVDISELTYLEEMYRAGAAPYFDILSANGYGFEDPPQAPPEPGRLNFRRVELVRQIMEKYGDQDKAIWLNEYGWNAAPAEMPAERLLWGRVSEQQKARWTVEGIEYARQHWPWAGVICIWYFRGVEDLPALSDAAYYFRMVNFDFTALPVYWEVQQAARALGTATPGRYEESGAPVRRRGEWLPVYSDRASGGAYIASNEPGSLLELTFAGTDLSVRVRKGPNGGRLLVTVDGISGRGTSLPRDEFGRAYLELYSPEEAWIDVTLISGLERELPPGSHRLELTVAEEAAPESEGHACALDAFEVSCRRSYLLFAAIAGLLLGSAGTAMVSLVLELRRPPAPRPLVAPVNPWTLRPEQLADLEDEDARPSPEAKDGTLSPTEES